MENGLNIMFRPRNLALLGLLILTVGVLALFLGRSGPPKPTMYADGSVEYALSAPYFGKQPERAGYPKVWVIRFPDLIECTWAPWNDICWRYEAKKKLPEFTPGSIPGMSTYLSIPDLGFLDKGVPFLGAKADALGVLVSSVYLKYRELTPAGKEAGFYGTQQLGPYCKLDGELVPGLIKLRNLTDSEDAEFLKANPRRRTDPYTRNRRSRLCVGPKTVARSRYQFFVAPNKPMGKVSCSRSSIGTRTGCSVSVWLPQQRRVNLSFGKDHLEDLPNLYRRIAVFFSNATVLEKSINLNWKRND